jgi:hypothetical protein
LNLEDAEGSPRCEDAECFARREDAEGSPRHEYAWS